MSSLGQLGSVSQTKIITVRPSTALQIFTSNLTPQSSPPIMCNQISSYVWKATCYRDVVPTTSLLFRNSRPAVWPGAVPTRLGML